MSCNTTEYIFMRMHALAETYNFTWSFKVDERLYVIRKQDVLPERVQAEIRTITNGHCRIEVYV